MDVQKVMEGLDALFDTRQTDKIEDYLSENLEQALKEGDVGCAITIINELIGFYRDSSQYDKAEKYCEKLLPFLDKAGLRDTIHYGTSCLNIANAYRASGKLDASLEHYKMVFDIYEKTLPSGDMRYASLHNNLSLLYQEMGQFDKACEELLSALEIVKTHPEARVELGVTYSNLAASYVKTGELAKAKDAVEQAEAVFQDGLTEDYHYTATLSGAGDVYFSMARELEANGIKCEKEEAGTKTSKVMEYYEKAASSYEKSMLLLKSHMGLTHAYFRIASNLKTTFEKLGKGELLQGLNLCEAYYEEIRPVFEKAVIEACEGILNEITTDKVGEGLLNEITIGKVGEGSECFGYDDLLSIDHDFGPGFCIFVTREQYNEYGKLLEAAYNNPQIAKVFHGFERPPVIPDKPRNGVIVIEDFFKRILELSDGELSYLMEHKTLPEETFIRLDDWQLKTVTNGRLFYSNQLSIFEVVYNNLKKGYPETVRRRKIAQCLGEMSQSGQYNYQRMMLRGDVAAAKLMIDNYVRSALHLLYLMNREYAPHDKWLFEGARWLSLGADIVDKISELLVMTVDRSVYEIREMLEWIGTTNKEDKVLAKVNEIAADFVKLMNDAGLTDSNEVYLEEHISLILS